MGATRPQRQEAIIDPPAPVLRKVISLAGQTLTIDEHPASLISVDVWLTMVTLRLAHNDSELGSDPARLCAAQESNQRRDVVDFAEAFALCPSLRAGDRRAACDL